MNDIDACKCWVPWHGLLHWCRRIVPKMRAENLKDQGCLALPVMHLMCVDVQCAEHLLEDVKFRTGILVHQRTQA